MFGAIVVAAAQSAMHMALAQHHANQREAEALRQIGMSDKEIFMVFENRRLASANRQAEIEAADKARPRGIGIFW
jgi:hypothetical protein